MRDTAAAPALLALLLLLGCTGCGAPADRVEPTAEPTSTTSTPAAQPSTSVPAGPADRAPGVPPFPATARPDDGGHGSGNGLGLTGVRTARHPGWDRVVFDLGGTGTPGWYVDYTTRPRAEGSGDRVRIGGTVFLQVVLRGVGLPIDTGIEQFADSTARLPGTGTEGVAEIVPGGVFEGEQSAFIGLTGAERPFRAFALTDPTRVVVDIRHD